MIPKKLYFTYATAELPDLYRWNLERWKSYCPDWEIHYFCDQKIYALFNEYFPEYSKDLLKIPVGAVLADVFRYAVLYIEGGMYMDIDTIPLKPIPTEWLTYALVVGYELQPSKFPGTPAGRDGYNEVFCQWALLSVAKHPFLKEVLEQSFEALRMRQFQFQTIKDILEIAGPLRFTSVMEKYKNQQNLLLLDMDVFASTEQYLNPTENSVVKHQFHGHLGWQLELQARNLKLNSLSKKQ